MKYNQLIVNNNDENCDKELSRYIRKLTYCTMMEQNHNVYGKKDNRYRTEGNRDKRDS